MAKKKKAKFKYDPEWAKAKKVCRMSAEDIRMAKELGFSPRTLMKNNPSPHQAWKQPVKVWIRELYEKRKCKQAQTLQLELHSEPQAAPLSNPEFLDQIPF